MSDDKPEVDVNHLIAERRAKLERLRERGGAFPNDFRRDSTAEQLHLAYGGHPPEWFEAHPTRVDHRRPHDVQARHGQGELRQAQGPQRA